MKYFSIINANWKHKLGNIIQAFVNILDALIMILSLGNISSNLSWSFIKYRLFKKPFLYQQKETK